MLLLTWLTEQWFDIFQIKKFRHKKQSPHQKNIINNLIHNAVFIWFTTQYQMREGRGESEETQALAASLKKITKFF